MSRRWLVVLVSSALMGSVGTAIIHARTPVPRRAAPPARDAALQAAEPKPAPKVAQPKPSAARARTARPAPAPPASLQRFSPTNVDRLATAHGDVWARDYEHNRVLRFGADGTNKGSIAPGEFLRGFQMIPTGTTAWLAADDGGVWLGGRSDRGLSRTRARYGCPSIARTGPDRPGHGVLIRFSISSYCPTKILDFTPDDDGYTPQGVELLPNDVAFAGGTLWAGYRERSFQVDTRTAAINAGPNVTIFGAGFGSIWGATGSSGGSIESVEIMRIDPATRTGKTVAASTFSADCGVTEFEVLCTGYEPGFFWIDPRTDSKYTLEYPGGPGNPAGTLTSSRHTIFRADQSAGWVLQRWETKTGKKLSAIHGPLTRSEAAFAYREILWVASKTEGLFWMRVPR